MLPLIDYIKTSLSEASCIEEGLKFLPMHFKKNFPVAYIHSQARMKSKHVQEAFTPLLDNDGFTPTHLDQKGLDFFQDRYPELLQSVSYMCVKKESKEPILYSNNRINDYWKKIQTVQNFKAVFEISTKQDEQPCDAEFSLREIIRKRKEVHALKPLGFIYLVDSSEDLTELCEHYFAKRYVCVNERYYIAWAKTLQEINMRYFLCLPSQKQLS